MNEYKKLSHYFDQIMEFIDYTQWENFTLSNIKKNSTILDLACGSGIFMLLMFNNNFEIEGLDLSEEMLEHSYDLLMGNHIHPTLYCQDMTNFNTNKKYDVITCYFDSINHLPTLEDVKKCMTSVYNHLNEGGLFLFDVFTYSRFLECKDTSISEEFEDFNYTWNTDIKLPNTIIHDITIDSEEGNIHEVYNEYYYDINDFIDLSKFRIKKIVGDFKDVYNEDDERMLVVLERI